MCQCGRVIDAQGDAVFAEDLAQQRRDLLQPAEGHGDAFGRGALVKDEAFHRASDGFHLMLDVAAGQEQEIGLESRSLLRLVPPEEVVGGMLDIV